MWERRVRGLRVWHDLRRCYRLHTQRRESVLKERESSCVVRCVFGEG